ncbi:MAG: beta strand repeat-containing protein [Telluria sp.]
MPTSKPSINLDQWADGAAPDQPVTSGSQADQWQNGNLGASQAHYNEGESVPYRAVLNSLKEGTIYWVTLTWDTTKGGKHALDYLTNYDASFPSGRNETVPVPSSGVTDPLATLGLSTSVNIPLDANAHNQAAGAIKLYGGASFLNFALPGADGKFGTADDVNNPSNPYVLTGSYAGDSSTSLTLKFLYTGNGTAPAGQLGSAVVAWGGHIAARPDWGVGNSAAAISGSPYHTALTSFVDNDPATSESVGQQDRSLASAAVTFPGAITVTKQTDPDGSPQSFNFEFQRPANTVDVLSNGTAAGSGLLDLSGDGVITSTDTGRFTDSDGEVYSVTAGGALTRISGSGDGKINGHAIIGGQLDVDNSGTITTADKLTNLTGTGVTTFALTDGASKTFGNLLDLGSGYSVHEVVPATWDLTSVNTTRTDINGVTTTGTIANPAGDTVPVTLNEADQVGLTFNDHFLGVPAINVVKTNGGVVDGDGNGPDAGDTVVYSYSVQNTGNIALLNVSLADDKLGAIALSGLTDVDGDGQADDLATGASATGTGTATLTQAQVDSGSVTNVATGTGTGTEGTTVTDTDTNTVTIARNPAIGVVKTNGGVTDVDANGQDAGDTVTYHYTVTNTGNVSLLNVSASDDKLGALTLSGLTDLDGDGQNDDLAVGAAATASATATLTQAQVDAGSVTNVVNTSGTGTDGTAVSAADTNTVPITRAPALDVVKTNGGVTDVDGNGADAGDTITYNYAVHNTGNVTLLNVSATDDKLGALTLSGLTDLDGDGQNDDLAVGATATASATATLTQAQVDAGSVTNVVTAGGNGPDGTPVSDTDTNTVTIPGNPDINIIKTNTGVTDTDGNGDDAGDTITYHYTVRNLGTISLLNVSASDDKLGALTLSGLTDIDGDGQADDLAVGASATATATATLTQAQVDAGSVTNIASDIGTGTDGTTVTSSDTNTVNIDRTPAIQVVKSNTGVTDTDGNGTDAGDTVTYNYAVTNTGNTSLLNVSLSDDKLGAIALTGLTDLDGDGQADDLAVGATVNGTATTNLVQSQIDAGSVTNIATASGKGTDGSTVTDTDTNTVSLATSQSIDIEKYVSVDNGATYQDADTAAAAAILLDGTNPLYRFVVINTGNTTLSNVSLHDLDTTNNVVVDLNGGAAGTDFAIGTLVPGATFTLTNVAGAFHSGLQTDIGTATGTGAQGGTVTDSDAANYNGFQPVTFTGNPQFNFPNSVDKIQPKLQGGSFTINAKADIYWDFFTANSDLVQIDTRAGTYSSDYAGLKVSIVKIWDDGSSGGADAVYRVYVANETDNPISLANNTNIASYSIVNKNLQPALSTDKGMLDLINADPLIGNFNNFSNIENALAKDATDNILTNPSAAQLTSAANRVWSSPDESGTATNEAAANVDALGGNDFIYGRNNAAGSTDVLAGSAGNDMIDGRAGADSITGGDGDDWLSGSLSGDIIIGGNGNDVLFGSYGHDILTGGAGADNFILRRGDFDTITDFDYTTGDRITLWVDSLDNTGAAGHAVTYDNTSGILSVDGAPVAELTATGGLHPASVGVIGTNPNTANVFIT